MNCTEARHHWNLYHDSEGDPELHFQISEHIGTCPDCAEWFHKQSGLETLLADKLRDVPGAPDTQLWDSVLRRSGLAQPVPARRRWLWLGLAACAATLLMALLWTTRSHQGAGDREFARLTVAWHQRLAEGEETVEFASRSDQEVETYLKKRVSFPVRCPPRQDAGFEVRGAGVGELSGQAAAYLSGFVDSAPVSIIILPQDGLDGFSDLKRFGRADEPLHMRHESYRMVFGRIDRNAVVVVGRASPERLERVLVAYGTYPDHE